MIKSFIIPIPFKKEKEEVPPPVLKDELVFDEHMKPQQKPEIIIKEEF